MTPARKRNVGHNDRKDSSTNSTSAGKVAEAKAGMGRRADSLYAATYLAEQVRSTRTDPAAALVAGAEAELVAAANLLPPKACPFWQSMPCPSWCTMKHSDDHHPAALCDGTKPEFTVLSSGAVLDQRWRDFPAGHKPFAFRDLLAYGVEGAVSRTAVHVMLASGDSRFDGDLRSVKARKLADQLLCLAEMAEAIEDQRRPLARVDRYPARSLSIELWSAAETAGNTAAVRELRAQLASSGNGWSTR